MNITQKLLIIFLCISLVPLCTISLIFVNRVQQDLTAQTLEALDATASRQENRLNSIFAQNLERLTIFTRKLQLRLALDAYLHNKTQDNFRVLQEVLREARSTNPNFKDMVVVDTNGQVVSATDEGVIGSNVADETFFKRGTRNSVSLLYQDKDGQPGFYLSGPVVLTGNSIGIVGIQVDGDDLIALLSDYSGLGETGETYIAQRDVNGGAIFVGPSRFDPHATLQRRLSNSDINEPVIRALHKQEGTFVDTIDYRGEKVFSATRYSPEADWGLAVTEDSSVATAPLVRLLKVLFSLLLVVALAVAASALYFTKLITDPIVALTKTAQRMREGDLSQKFSVRSHDEIAQLAKSFTELAASLAEERDRLSAVIASMGEGMIVVNTTYEVTLINYTAEKHLGIPSKDALGSDVRNVFPILFSGHSISEETHPVTRMFKEGKVITITSGADFYSRNAYGKIFPLSLVVAPLRGDGITGAVIVFNDISEQKALDKARIDFISIASHQLRTPLATIRWFTEILLGDIGESLDKYKRHHFLELVYASAERMVRLVNLLLQIARVDAGRLKIDPIPIDLAALSEEIVLAMKAMFEVKYQKVEIVAVPDPLPSVPLDREVIWNVIQNLLSNASQYSPIQSTIFVSITLKKDMLEYSVRDQGIGIPETQQERIFEKFFRAENALEMVTTGSGLGLSLVKDLVEGWGGKVWFTSQVGKGSTFFFTVPLKGMEAKEGEVKLAVSV